MMMQEIEAQDVIWFAVRVQRKQVGGIRTITVGGEFEEYRDRKKRKRLRRVDGTGERVFLPEHLLRRAGFEVFLPVKKVLRRKNRFSPEKQLVSQPLLVDWLFVALPVVYDPVMECERLDRWADLMRLDVVSGVMGTGGRPVRIPQARINRLMRQWGGGHLSPECQSMLKAKKSYVAGDVIEVPDGPFAGLDFKIVDVSDKVAKGVIDIFGRETPLEVQLDNLPVNVEDQSDALPKDADADLVFDPLLSACSCGSRMAEVVKADDGYCVTCGNCGRRGAVKSGSEGEARKRWNKWAAGKLARGTCKKLI